MQMPCPKCAAQFNVSETLLGKRVRCPKCGEVFFVPSAQAVNQGVVSDARTTLKTTNKPPVVQRTKPDDPAIPQTQPAPSVVVAPVPQDSGRNKDSLRLKIGIGLMASLVIWLLAVIGSIWYGFSSEKSRLQTASVDLAPETSEKSRARSSVVKHTTIRLLQTLDAPKLDIVPDKNQSQLWDENRRVINIRFSNKHELLFLSDSVWGIWVIDAKNGAIVHSWRWETQFNIGILPFDLAADESVLFALSPNDSHYHTYGIFRYDLAARNYEIANSFGGRGGSVQVIDASHFAANLHADKVGIFKWEGPHRPHSQVSVNTVSEAMPLVYNPIVRRLYLGAGIKFAAFDVVDMTIHLGETAEHRGVPVDSVQPQPSCASIDGVSYYCGRLQLNALDVRRPTRTFTEPIYAATQDVAFGVLGYYDAETGEKLGELNGPSKAMALSRDGKILWTYDLAAQKLYQYAIERTSQATTKK